MTRHLSVLGVLALMGALASGCSRAQARTTPDGPPLDIPMPPPRDVETTETEPPAPMPLPQEPARNTPPRPRPAPAREQPRSEPARPEPPKPEPPASPDAARPPDVEGPVRPPSTLQTKPAGEEGDVERGIRTMLAHANTDLNRVDYRTLNPDAKAQYDTAKRFIRQAEDALRAKNLLFAKTIAEKAAALAAQLAGR